jgi:hypothetical protein
VTVADLAIIAGLVFAWGTLSARLERFDVTAPIVFTAAGVLLTHGLLAPLGITPGSEVVKVLAEATLALVLFSDASRVGLRQLRADLGLCLRLLGIGLPLAIGLGTLAAFILPGVSDIWLALLIGAALAPTDAALGAGMMVNRAVPARIRRLINVESGLNDGIATPFVLVAIAGAATAEHAASTGPGKAVAELALGLLIGAAVGGGGWLVKVARGSGWAAEGFAGAAVLGLALCSYATSVALRGNGFIAAFTGGLAFAVGGEAGSLRRGDRHHAVAAGLPDVRGGRGSAGADGPDLADGAVCGAQPDRDPDAAGSGRAGRGPARPARRAVHRLVRPAWPGLGRLRAARAGRPGRAGGQAGHHRDRRHRAAQRAGTRAERGPAGQPLRPPAHPATRRRRPGRAGRGTRTTPHPPRTRRQPARGTGKSPMSTDQIPLRAGRRRRAEFPHGRVRAR